MNSKKLSHDWLDLLRGNPKLYGLFLTARQLSTSSTMIRPTQESSLNFTRFSFGLETFNGNQEEENKLVETTEFTVTGCIDCGAVKALPASEISESSPVFSFGSQAVRMWRDIDQKHTLVIVAMKPHRVFLTCQPYDKLTTEYGIAAILNFVEHIKPEQEVNNVPIS